MKEKLLALRRFAKPSALSAGALALSTRAMAEIPAEVTTNTSAIKTDGVTIATAENMGSQEMQELLSPDLSRWLDE